MHNCQFQPSPPLLKGDTVLCGNRWRELLTVEQSPPPYPLLLCDHLNYKIYMYVYNAIIHGSTLHRERQLENRPSMKHYRLQGRKKCI